MASAEQPYSAEQAFDLQEEFLNRKKANTFKERRKEGKTTYTRSSYAVMVIGGFSLLFNFIGIGMPYWRSSWVAVIGYGHARHWGLFYLQGRAVRLHHEVSDIACKHMGETMLGGTCIDPLCRWYQLKCLHYYDFYVQSYVIGVVLVCVTIIYVLVMRWMIILNPRTIKFANMWVRIATFLQLASIIAWFFFSEMMFSGLEEMAYYPRPPFGLSFFLMSAAVFGWIVVTVLVRILRSMWPEVDPDDPDQFASDEDDDDEEDSPNKQREWFYKDLQGAEQGPFKSSEMIGWIDSGHLPTETLVRAAEESDYSELGNGSKIKNAPTIGTPLPGKTATAAAGERTWFYQDTSGNIQGPFPTSQMRSWLSEKHFPPETLIRAADETDFTPLGDGSRVF
eukprot:CAMPEP_0197662688 /NCGR_PEP_ID=MMETSP1338-20131121/54349_1 /TAXON_ID=43686 ORGANISM="Pelagodinium beii, Strain RCC1491" /NCGR_SAMPLE_ID=MMETSP1338 /ASSEMBLY_ACC=CAM_ASM_000754 /LENGTH=393 /DNA_ID=CAMNT_0043240633 /DNA_START=119 /DNA_END=1300 /DNA_ORIENTATION=+